MSEKLRSVFQRYGLWFFIGLILAGFTIGGIVTYVDRQMQSDALATPQYTAQPADPSELTFDLEQNKAYSAEDGLVVIEPVSAKQVKSASVIDDPDKIWEEDQVITYNSFTLADKVKQEDGSLGVLTIPDIGLSVNVFAAEQGQELEAMTKGLAHFSHTSSWDGNIGICGHNVNFDLSDGYFKNLYQLKKGDKLTYSTSLGERSYEVQVSKSIAEDDWSYLGRTAENKITLITCISGQPTKRLVVQAVEVK